jgi:NAD(P)-dependent dehydrogenase (short-subunit alcohol dehydrogenase family)
VERRKVALVTGGSRGIGRGIVCALGGLGLDVVVNYRSNRAAAESTVEQAIAAGARSARAIQADVAELDGSARMVDTVVGDLGRIDVLVNNAGIAPPRRLDLLETTPENWNAVLDTNLRGAFFLTQIVARAMVRSGVADPSDDPQIHFITSISSVFASVNRGEYCVAKAGLSMVAQLFAVRLAAHGIRVFEIRPGVIDTDMTGPVHDVYDRRLADGLAPINRWGTPEDVGRVVAGLVSGFLPYATGNVIEVDGGLHLRAF